MPRPGELTAGLRATWAFEDQSPLSKGRETFDKVQSLYLEVSQQMRNRGESLLRDKQRLRDFQLPPCFTARAWKIFPEDGEHSKIVYSFLLQLTLIAGHNQRNKGRKRNGRHKNGGRRGETYFSQ